MNKQRILDLIDERKDELFELLSSFIKINSINFRTSGNEKDLATYIHKLCKELNLESDIYSPLEIENFENHPDYLCGGNLENRYNVTARWRGKEDIDDLMLMGHTDTVEIGSLENWKKDPFSGEISDGKIWGRGACDDKYALATALFLIKLLKEQGFVPKKNVLFSAYIDEEHGGSHGALATVLKYPTPRIVNMDCIEDQIWHCASGGQVISYKYHTKDAVNSAKKIADALPLVMEELEKFGDRRRKELSENPFYNGTDIPETALRYMDIHLGKDGTDLGCGSLSMTFYTDKSKEEIQTEFIALEKALSEKLAPLGIISDGITPNTRYFHYVYCDPELDDIKEMLRAFSEATGETPIVSGSCLSDLSVISKYGSSNAYAVGIGRDFNLPGGSHQPDEFIECDKFLSFTKTMAVYIINTMS